MDRRIAYALTLIEKHYARPLRLIPIATKVRLSPSHFEHLFKQQVGHSFKAYLKRVRLQKAAELLRHPDLKIADIARHSGYADASNFIRDFRQCFKKTPRDYSEEFF